jgi:hypothetical protein
MKVFIIIILVFCAFWIGTNKVTKLAREKVQFAYDRIEEIQEKLNLDKF